MRFLALSALRPDTTRNAELAVGKILRPHEKGLKTMSQTAATKTSRTAP